MTAARPDNPGVIARPPLLTLGAFLSGGALEWLRPTGIPGGVLRSVLGLLLAVGGAALIATAMRQFRAAGTNIETYKPSETIVSDGLYGRSRNPIYVAMALILIGLGLAVDSLWVIAMVAPLLLVLRYGVIAREERYLTRKFGETYRAYTARVRRWL
jgi:protein-S-isoprenylcysteine O-methyltransferase Ste14